MEPPRPTRPPGLARAGSGRAIPTRGWSRSRVASDSRVAPGHLAPSTPLSLDRGPCRSVRRRHGRGRDAGVRVACLVDRGDRRRRPGDVADIAFGCSIETQLPAATTYTTAELSLSFLRPATPPGTTLAAHGQAIHVGRSVALSEVFVLDREASGCSPTAPRGCRSSRRSPIPRSPRATAVLEPRDYGSPDPYLASRPRSGHPAGGLVASYPARRSFAASSRTSCRRRRSTI